MSDPHKPNEQQAAIFQFFTEIDIIKQLSSALLNKTLPDGVHVSHFAVISHLMRMGDGKTPAEITSVMQVTKATMTHTLNVLQKRNLIEVRANPDDGRSKQVYLTPAGRQFFGKAIAMVAAAYQPIMAKCDVPQLLATLPALQALRKVLDENR